MLKITVPLSEHFDDTLNEFVVEGYPLELEHSLASLSKWEQEFEKPFLGVEEKTVEETLFYIRECMTITPNVPREIFDKLSKGNYDDIQKYINKKGTATWFNEPTNRPMGSRNKIITSEVIYGWLVALRIPFSTEDWYLNRLFTLIKVCNEQTKQPKKMGRAEAARQQHALNAKRRAEMNSRG